MNLPNKLTLLRILLIPVFIIIMMSNITNHYLIACLIFIIASITDALDGYIARKNNLVTDFGKVMDAIKAGKDAKEAYEANIGTYGRFSEAVKTIDPRKK